MKVAVICEFSGIVRDAFIKQGHEAISFDLLPTEQLGPHRQGDIKELPPEYWKQFDLAICHPPCTYLTVAGNKWYGEKYRDRFPDRYNQMQDAIEFFMYLVNLPVPKMAIENPVGRMSSLYRKPDQIIQPYQYGHPVRKSTCLWLKNLPALAPTKIVDYEIDVFLSGNKQSKWHTETGHIKDKQERSKARSKTFAGIAQAMAEQWGRLNNE
jgi:hypothetical protein